jgi:hypothetical protein
MVMTKTRLQRKLDEIDEAIQNLVQDRQRAIEFEPATFEYLEVPEFAWHDRYFLIYGDGTLAGYRSWQRKPTALRSVNAGRYIYDVKDGAILDRLGQRLADAPVRELPDALRR